MIVITLAGVIIVIAVVIIVEVVLVLLRHIVVEAVVHQAVLVAEVVVPVEDRDNTIKTKLLEQ